jgi:EMC6
MMDPMGDVGAGGVDNTAVAASLDAGTGTYHNLKSNEIVDPLIVQLNLSRIERIRSVMGIASGCIAGILGLTGMEGFGTYSDKEIIMTMLHTSC